jgi:hypothetical protein
LCAFTFLPFVSLCPVYCILTMFLGTYLKDNPQAHTNLCFLMFLGSCAAWVYIYILMFDASLYYLFINFGLFLGFMCCAGCLMALL